MILGKISRYEAYLFYNILKIAESTTVEV